MANVHQIREAEGNPNLAKPWSGERSGLAGLPGGPIWAPQADYSAGG